MAETEIVGGKNAVMEILKARKRRCHEIFVALSRKEKTVSELKSFSDALGIPFRTVTNEELSSMCGVEKHQGVAARVDSFSFTPLGDVVSKALSDEHKGLILVLDGILDPHNLGSLIRTASLMGVHGIVLPKDNSAPISAVTVKVSAGATEHMPICQVTNIVSTLKELKNECFWIIGAEGTSKDNIYLYDFTDNNYVLVMGGEGKGIRRLVKETCDHLLSIPMSGGVESYNVSVAGAIIMSEIRRQRFFKNCK